MKYDVNLGHVTQITIYFKI
jgi:hypothetical protein